MGKQQAMVDCGAYIGDTLSTLLDEVQYKKFDKYICFEMDSSNYKILKKKVGDLSEEIRNKICIYNQGVGKKHELIRYNSNGASTGIMSTGSLAGEIVSLDEKIGTEDVSFIKMDIEGSEMDALYGARKIIEVKKPTCAICIYHSIRDMFEIPQLLKRMQPEYSLILRHHTEEWWDTVCYAKVGSWEET